MDKMDKPVMVVDTNTLFEKNYFNGFLAKDHFDFESIILDNYKYVRRGDVEEDLSYKQPIAYSLIVNPTLKQVFAYQRSSKEDNYTEKRLYGLWSVGVGGHIDEIDTKNENPIRGSLLRELDEEIEGLNNLDIKVLGYINDDYEDVGKVHFGILYVTETDSIRIRPKDGEICKTVFGTFDEILNLFKSKNKFEGWSEIVKYPLLNYVAHL